MALPDTPQEVIDQVIRDQNAENTINLLDFAVTTEEEKNEPPDNSYKLAQFSEDEIPFRFFTANASQVLIHYIDTSEHKGSIKCNGDDCVLCQIGIKKQEQLTFPALDLRTNTIVFISISKKISPHTALAQFIPILMSKDLAKQIVFISKPNKFTFKVTTAPLTSNIESGDVQIKDFVKKFDKGEIDLTSIYQSLPNEQLSVIPEITRMLHLKGIVK